MRRTALITGGAKRLGQHMAKHLAANGWNIVIHYNRSVLSAARLKKELDQQYPEGEFAVIKADLNEMDQIDELIHKTINIAGKIDLLINNASVFDPSFIADTTNDFYERQMTVNFKAPFFLTKHYSLLQNKGLIVNLTDTRITRNEPNFAAYTLSKKMLWELTKMSAIELGPNFRVNAIAPGATLPPENETDDYLEALAKKTPMQVPSGVTPILNSLDYIISNQHLTGQILFCDGGENLGKPTH
ncbi:SDR family oxidoreductase [Prolixibacteraceae bacterium JC049]|nr:SDR family oxidoreductase [Prolixibacteraceae bacterium JC049]